MISYERYCQIRLLTQQGLSVTQISAACGLNERTVRHWQEQATYRPRKSVRHPSKLDPFRDLIVRWLAEHPYTAVQLLRKLREAGYTGGYSILKKCVLQLRPPAQKPYLSLAFEPGDCAQVDWGYAGSMAVGATTRRLSFFVMVLCYSRKLYVEFTLLERQEQFLACHQNAFQYFGGVPRRIMLDNLKSAVLSHPRGQPAVYHPRYLDFASHYGFAVSACNVRSPNEKGRVENAVGYVKKSFLLGLELSSLPAVQTAARQWLDEVANTRLHATTRRTPNEMFKEERLLPLPVSGMYDTGSEREALATSLFRVHFDGNRYSVPARHAGTRVRVRAYPDKVLLYRNEQLLATHVRSYERGCDIVDPGHESALVQQRRHARDQQTLQRFLRMNQAESYYQQLAEHRTNPFLHVRRIVGLSEIYGIEKTERALMDAMEFGAYSAEYIANILEQRTRARPEPGALHLTRGADLLELDIPETDLSIYDTGTSS